MVIFDPEIYVIILAEMEEVEKEVRSKSCYLFVQILKCVCRNYEINLSKH